jgi:hypothetical protein
VQLRVIHADTALMQFDQLRKHNVELLISECRGRSSGRSVSEPLFTNPLPRWQEGQPVGAASSIELAELAEEAWVLPPPDSVPGVLIAEIFATCIRRLRLAGILTLSVQLTTTMIATGRFVGMLPGSVARFSASAWPKILPVKVPTVLGSVNVITVKNRTPSRSLSCSSTRRVRSQTRSRRRHRDGSPRPPQVGEEKAQLQLGRCVTLGRAPESSVQPYALLRAGRSSPASAVSDRTGVRCQPSVARGLPRRFQGSGQLSGFRRIEFLRNFS